MNKNKSPVMTDRALINTPLQRGAGPISGELQVFELLLRDAGLFQDGPKRAGRHVGGVHCDIRLPTVGVAQHGVRTRLPSDDEPGALQASQDFTSLVGHPRKVPEWKTKYLLARELFRDWAAFRHSIAAPDRGPRPERPPHPARAWSAQAKGCVR